MHELSLMQDLVENIGDQLGGQRVTRVRLEIGDLAAVVPDALHFSFDVCTRGTPLEGAALEIISIRGRGACRSCGGDVALQAVWSACACGSYDVEVRSGTELRLRDVEVM